MPDENSVQGVWEGKPQRHIDKPFNSWPLFISQGILKRISFIIQTVFTAYRVSAALSSGDALCVNVK